MKPSPTLRPSVGGTSGRPSAHQVGDHPWGEKIAAKRVFGIAPDLLSGVCAGSIESSSGKASETPAPCRKVRLGRCFLEMNIVMPFLLQLRALSTVFSLTFILNGALFTIPRTSDEKR